VKNSLKKHPSEISVRGGAEDRSEAPATLKRQLKDLCKTRAEKLRVVAFLLRELLKHQPSAVEWALTDPDGKVYAYVTPVEEWHRRRLSSSRMEELARRSRTTVEPKLQTTT
jgi:hypothetical protein